jgi:hypothetical protein
MTAALLRFLTLLALVLMPFGMAGAPAVAQPMAADHAAMAMGGGNQGSRLAQHGGKIAGGHCDEQPVKDNAPAPSKMDCTAMCTALLAADCPMPGPAMTPVAPRSIAAAVAFAGIEPEIATPPPRQA